MASLWGKVNRPNKGSLKEYWRGKIPLFHYFAQNITAHTNFTVNAVKTITSNSAL